MRPLAVQLRCLHRLPEQSLGLHCLTGRICLCGLAQRHLEARPGGSSGLARADLGALAEHCARGILRFALVAALIRRPCTTEHEACTLRAGDWLAILVPLVGRRVPSETHSLACQCHRASGAATTGHGGGWLHDDDGAGLRSALRSGHLQEQVLRTRIFSCQVQCELPPRWLAHQVAECGKRRQGFGSVGLPGTARAQQPRS
mmetsp:Transcript_5067/g.14823  ORF Transcript_5067/g.14823 Transcript_5067/m.14823 type:complete len:202 (-) Transcript_5067:120-725(-)